jgi:hypothetical protein
MAKGEDADDLHPELLDTIHQSLLWTENVRFLLKVGDM